MLALFRLRFTLALVLAMLAANALGGATTGTIDPVILGNFGFGVREVLGGEAWRLLTAIPLSHDAAMLGRQLLFAALAVGAYEWRHGWRLAAALFVLSDLAASLILALGLGAALAAGASESLDALDVGISGGGFAAIGALAASLPRGRSVMLAVLLGALALKPLVLLDPVADLLHPLALLIGFGLHGVLAPRLSDRRGRRTPPGAGAP